MDFPSIPVSLPDCRITAVEQRDTTLTIIAQTNRTAAACPDCHSPSSRVHSRYLRILRDLPILDSPVLLHLTVRRFFCDQQSCSRSTFAEDLPALAPRRARRTLRRSHTLLALVQALGAEAGARLAKRLHLSTSPSTLLRVIRAHTAPIPPSPRVLGIDDFAFRKGRRYGTLLVDLERRRPIAILGDRTAETLASWLKLHPDIEIIARDRASDYARGASLGAPHACQVADRFHLLCNLRDLAERYAHRVSKRVRELLSSPAAEQVIVAEPSGGEGCQVQTSQPAPRYKPSPTLRQIQAARKSQRAERFAAVKAYHANGWSNQQIAQAVGLSRHTVRIWLRAEELPADQRGYRGASKIDRFAPYLHQRLAEGMTHQSGLWREIQAQGFDGTRSLVAKWIQAHPASEKQTRQGDVTIVPSAKALAWLLIGSRERQTDEEQQVLNRLQQDEELLAFYHLVQRFGDMVRERREEALDDWLADARASGIGEVVSFVQVLRRDEAAVRAGLCMPYSTGPVEGHIHRLKLIKRSGYGRAGLDHLRQRVLAS